MTVLVPSWRPKKRNVRYQERPEGIPDWVHTQAITAKRAYNENWEFWVWQVSLENNCSQAEAEDACIRGIQQEFHRFKLVYGDSIGQWFESYMEMGDLMQKVTHPEYLKNLGENKANG